MREQEIEKAVMWSRKVHKPCQREPGRKNWGVNWRKKNPEGKKRGSLGFHDQPDSGS